MTHSQPPDQPQGERTNRTGGKIEEWVNAVITLTIPMNLPHHATKTEKLDAAEAEYDQLDLPTDFVAEVTWEDAPAPEQGEAQERCPHGVPRGPAWACGICDVPAPPEAASVCPTCGLGVYLGWKKGCKSPFHDTPLPAEENTEKRWTIWVCRGCHRHDEGRLCVGCPMPDAGFEQVEVVPAFALAAERKLRVGAEQERDDLRKRLGDA